MAYGSSSFAHFFSLSCPHTHSSPLALTLTGDFDSTKRFFVLFHDLHLAIELPAGVVALYPSSLLTHSNISFVEADDEDAAWSGKGTPRGSLVWFAQADYIISAEVGSSLNEVEKKTGKRPTFGAGKEKVLEMLGIRLCRGTGQ